MIDEPIHVESQDGKHAGQRIVRLTGKLTFPTPEEDDKFFKQILVPPAPAVILDLSGVSYCDSSGVGELMRVHIAFKREKRRLALAATREKVQTILKVARVFEYFNVFPTVEEAEAALI
jgi:anti-sigma B factor antagonist